jgi:hypothetical protein
MGNPRDIGGDRFLSNLHSDVRDQALALDDSPSFTRWQRTGCYSDKGKREKFEKKAVFHVLFHWFQGSQTKAGLR